MALKRLDDLVSIWRTYHSDQRADELVDELFDQAELLCVYPRAGAVEEWLNKGRFRYRRRVVGHVKIICRVTRTAVRVNDFVDRGGSEEDVGLMGQVGVLRSHWSITPDLWHNPTLM